MTIFATLLALHNLYPSLRPYTQPFFELSYYDPVKDEYVQGWHDIYFVTSGVIAFTAIRAIAIEWVFQPLARFGGLKKKASIRFAEQAWLCLYDGFFWSLGMVRPLLIFKNMSNAWKHSTCGRTLPIGSTSARSGKNGLRAGCLACTSCTFWRSCRSGCSRSLSSTWRNDERTTSRC